MKKIIGTLFIILSAFSYAGGQSARQAATALYPVVEEGRWGYIDSSGRKVIEPQFYSAGDFSEGLAPVRLHGTYGFIDEAGEFMIKPQWDAAYPFYQGQAKVYVNAKPYFIDKSGRYTFEHNFKDILGFNEEGLARVVTHSDKWGVINRQGKLVVDAIYDAIGPFSNGLALVSSRNQKRESEKSRDEFERGVINTAGAFIVPLGRYRHIATFKNGFAVVVLDVERQKGTYDHQGVIDSTGKLLFTIPAKKWKFSYGHEKFSEGLASVDIYTVDPDTVKVWSSSKRYDYAGVVNTAGEIVFSHPDWQKITPFKNNRAFVQDIHNNWHLIDKRGQTINKEPYKEILYKTIYGEGEYLFQQGTAFVRTEKGWGPIDSTGNFIAGPMALKYTNRDLCRRGGVLFFQKDEQSEDDEYQTLYGFWNSEKGDLLDLQLHRIGFTDFTDELALAFRDGKIAYVNRQGNLVWQEPVDVRKEQALNIDYMNRGYFYASSPKRESLNGLGGWAKSKNGFKEISPRQPFQKDKLSIRVQPRDKALYQNSYKGIKLYIANTSGRQYFFDAQDSRLALKIQARDPKGQWRDIEYLPESWCGNSYHMLYLAAGTYWEFVVPVYEGEFKTQLRAQLLYKENKDQKKPRVLYSNEFEGSVNPGQFWQKQPYMPSGLMDPYYE